MKESWQIKQLGEVCLDFIVPQRDKPKAFDGDIPWCRIEDIEGKYLNGSLSGQKVTRALADSMNMHICPKGTVICACSASIGNQAITTVDCYTNQTFIGIVPDPMLLYNEFLYFFLKSKKDELISMGTGSTIKYISRKKFEGLRIRIPSIDEQQRIVDELDLLTGIIEKKNAQLRDLDAMAQSIFYEMFGDPIANEKGWKYCALKEVATIVGGSTPKTNIEEYWGGSNYWVTPAEIHKERYYGATERTISDLAVKSSSLTLLPVGTVLLSSRAPIGKVAITTVPMYCNQGFKNIICSDRINNEYICQALLCKTDYLQALGTGATFKEISKKTTENIKIAIPPLNLQVEFATKVQKIEQQKVAISKSLIDAQALFDSKMSHYFE